MVEYHNSANVSKRFLQTSKSIKTTFSKPLQAKLISSSRPRHSLKFKKHGISSFPIASAQLNLRLENVSPQFPLRGSGPSPFAYWTHVVDSFPSHLLSSSYMSSLPISPPPNSRISITYSMNAIYC